MELLMLVSCWFILAASTAADEYCLRESLNITCSPEEVILMTSAYYGRMRGGRCIRADVGHLGCSTDVTSQLDEVCSGRLHCVFPVANLLQQKPCPDDFTSYLEASHTCIKVSQSRCVISDGFIFLKDQDGFIPLSMHSSKCPWSVNVDPLQTLRFTLYGFSQRRIQPESAQCPWSVIFEEGGRVSEHPLCHVTARETFLYASKTNTVTIRVLYKEKAVLPVAYFLKYQALGCPQLRVSGFAWVRQDEAKATVKCNHTEETWFLACSDRKWRGEVGNCSKATTGDMMATDSISNIPKVTSLPFGFMIAVVIGVLLGIVIGAIPLALVYVCLKRKWRRQPPSCYISEEPYYPDIQQSFGGSNSGAVYPALLKRTTNHTPISASPQTVRGGDAGRTPGGGKCCYGCAEPFAHVPNAAVQQWEKQTLDVKNGRQVECYRVLECPDVMAHVVALHEGIQANPALGKPGHEHVYESAGFGRTRPPGTQGTDTIPEDFVPVY